MIRLFARDQARNQKHIYNTAYGSLNTNRWQCLETRPQAIRLKSVGRGLSWTGSIRCSKQAVAHLQRYNLQAGKEIVLRCSRSYGSQLPAYRPPQSGLLSLLPRSVVPYAELIRLDKPTGTYYLFFPCLFSTLLAAPLATPPVSLLTVASTSVLFFSGALIMRGAGCTVNDLWDRNLDPHVRRTRLRPIARGAISPRSALVFTVAQLLVGLGVLVQFPQACLWYGIPSLFFVAVYPLAKRVTYYPQFVLGLTFSWGAIMGFPALGVDLMNNHDAFLAASYLYTSNVAWVVLYDTIYAHMDVQDDQKAGIKSIALKHRRSTKSVMAGLALLQTLLLAAAGNAAGSGPLFYIGSCGSTLATLGTMIYRVDLQSVTDCWWWFQYGCLLTGGGISLGLFIDYLVRVSEVHEDDLNKGDDTLRIPT